MASQLESKKREASKIRRRGERELKKVRSVYHRSSSGLAAAERKISSAREELTDISAVLAQKVAQRDSIQRLIAAAQDRLGREKESKEQTEQELEFAESDEDKQNDLYQLRTITTRIEELSAEIKERNKMIKKLANSIEQYEASRSKIADRIKKQNQAKPGFRDLIKSSREKTEMLAKQIVTKTKQEKSAINNLKKIQERLAAKSTKKRKKTVKKRTVGKKMRPKQTKNKTRTIKRKVTKPRRISKPASKKDHIKKKTAKKGHRSSKATRSTKKRRK